LPISPATGTTPPQTIKTCDAPPLTYLSVRVRKTGQGAEQMGAREPA